MIVLLVTLLWLISLIVVVLAAFHESRDKDAEPTDSGIKAALPWGVKALLAIGLAGLVLGVPAAVLSKADNRLPGPAGTYIVKSSPELSDGQTIFRATCGSCHALGAANSRGVYGPDLDEVLGAPGVDAKAISSRVSTAIKNGGATGKQMPANLLSGEDAKQVSDYVGAVAGK